jgi:hypothetical protein
MEGDYIWVYITCILLTYVTDSSDIANAGGALAVSIYAPYLVWNMTAVDMEIKPKSFLRQLDSVSYNLKPSITESEYPNIRTKLYVLIRHRGQKKPGIGQSWTIWI